MALDHLQSSQAVALGTGPRASKKLNYIRRSGEYSYKSDAKNTVSWEGNIPSQFDGIDDFLLHAEFHERKNGTIYREVEFALPNELDRQQRIELAEDIVRQFTDRQLDGGGAKILTPYCAGIHNIDGHNPHVHLVRAERHVQIGVNYEHPDKARFFKRQNKKSPEKGGLFKLENTDRFRKSVLAWERQTFESITNSHLEAAGLDVRIDMRSYKDRGIDKIPQIHEGAAARAIEKRTGQKSRRGKFNELVKERNEHMSDYESFRMCSKMELEQEAYCTDALEQAMENVRTHFDYVYDSAPEYLKKELQAKYRKDFGTYEEAVKEDIRRDRGDFEI